jgi:hypothetical protein
VEMVRKPDGLCSQTVEDDQEHGGIEIRKSFEICRRRKTGKQSQATSSERRCTSEVPM